MLKKIMLAWALTLTTATAAFATNYIEPGELKVLLVRKQPIILVDIQPHADFEKQHLAGSLETNAFPAKSDEEKRRLDKVLPLIKSSADPVVVVCPRGKSGAKNSYAYLVSRGVAEERLLILEGGIAEWPFEDLLAKGR